MKILLIWLKDQLLIMKWNWLKARFVLKTILNQAWNALVEFRFQLINWIFHVFLYLTEMGMFVWFIAFIIFYEQIEKNFMYIVYLTASIGAFVSEYLLKIENYEIVWKSAS